MESPAPKLLSYTSQSTNPGASADASYTSQPPVILVDRVPVPSPGPARQLSAHQPNRIFTPLPDQTFQPSVPQVPAVVPVDTPRMTFPTRHAFAGHGIPLNHRSFLLPRENVDASGVFREIEEIVQKRNPDLQIGRETLHESGFKTEERHYLVLQHGASTLFIYVAPVGDDLYISRSTSVLCTISAGRIIALVLMIMAIFSPLPVLPDVLAAINQDGGAGILTALGVDAILGPLTALVALASFITLIWYLIRSFAYWLREKDFKVYLRSLSLKDFAMDDSMLLEHVADATIRTAVGRFGLDASRITSPQEGYKQDRHIRLS